MTQMLKYVPTAAAEVVKTRPFDVHDTVEPQAEEEWLNLAFEIAPLEYDIACGVVVFGTLESLPAMPLPIIAIDLSGSARGNIPVSLRVRGSIDAHLTRWRRVEDGYYRDWCFWLGLCIKARHERVITRGSRQERPNVRERSSGPVSEDTARELEDLAPRIVDGIAEMIDQDGATRRCVHRMAAALLAGGQPTEEEPPLLAAAHDWLVDVGVYHRAALAGQIPRGGGLGVV